MGNESSMKRLTFPNLQQTERLTRHQWIHSQCEGSHFSARNSHVSHQNILFPSIKEPRIEMINLNTKSDPSQAAHSGGYVTPAVMRTDDTPCPRGPARRGLIAHVTQIQRPNALTVLDRHCQHSSPCLPILPCVHARSPFPLSCYFFSSVHDISSGCVWPRAALSLTICVDFIDQAFGV